MSTLAILLPTLETRGLLRVTMERAKPMVRFKHALTREATYNTILQARRVELHRAAAQTLADLNSQPDLEMVLTIADHWRRGNEDGQALETVLPHAQPLIYTGRSLSLTALLIRLRRENLTETQQRDLDIALADAHAARGEYEPARELYERTMPHIDTPELRARILQSLGVAAYHLGNYVNAIEYYRSSLELAEKQGDTGLQARATGGIGLAHWSLGDTTIAEELLRKSRDLVLENGESLELATAEYNMAAIYTKLGQYTQAIVSAEHALKLEQKFGHTSAAARCLQLLGACYHSIGDLESASEYYDQAIISSRALGDLEGTAIVQSNLAELYAEQRKFETANGLYELAIQYFRTGKQEFSLGYNLAGAASTQCLQAQTNLDAGLLQTAQRNALEALEIAHKISSPEIEGIAYRALAEITTEEGEFEQAEQYAKKSIELLTQVGLSLERERAYRTYRAIASRAAAKETRARGTVSPQRGTKG